MVEEPQQSVKDLLLGITVDEMRQKISGLSPKSDMAVGIEFLQNVLNEKGVAGVVDVIQRGDFIIDKEGRFYPYDFNKGGDLADYAKEYKKAKPNLMNRRNFLRISTWGVGGPILIANQVTKQGGKAWTAVNKYQGKENPQDNPLQCSHEFIQKSGTYYFGELMIGLGISAEAVNIWFDTKLENIANAISQMAKQENKDRDSKTR